MPRTHLATSELTFLGEQAHVAFGFDGEAGFDAAVLPFLAEGLAAGQRLVCVLDDPRPERFASLGDPDELAGRGQLHLERSERIFGGFSRGDHGALLAAAECSHDEALAAGHRGLRIVVDVTARLAEGERSLDSWLAWEQLTDRFFATHRALGACGLDRVRLDDAVVTAVGRVHPIVSIAGAEPSFRAFADDGADAVRLVGAVDAWSAEDLAPVLRAAPGTGPLVLDVSDLEHLDHRGLLALAALGSTDRAVRLVGASAVARRLVALLGLESPALDVERA